MCFLAMQYHTVRKTSKEGSVLKMNQVFFALTGGVITGRDCTVNSNTPRFEKSHFHQAYLWKVSPTDNVLMTGENICCEDGSDG